MFGLPFGLSFAMALPLLFCAGELPAADAYPSKPGRLILPFGAGASTGIIGRIFAQRFSEAWGQTLVVDNRPGAGGTMGTALAAKAAPDGYTIFTYGINQTITPEEFVKFIGVEYAKWKKAVALAGAKVE